MTWDTVSGHTMWLFRQKEQLGEATHLRLNKEALSRALSEFSYSLLIRTTRNIQPFAIFSIHGEYDPHRHVDTSEKRNT